MALPLHYAHPKHPRYNPPHPPHPPSQAQSLRGLKCHIQVTRHKSQTTSISHYLPDEHATQELLHSAGPEQAAAPPRALPRLWLVNVEHAELIHDVLEEEHQQRDDREEGSDGRVYQADGEQQGAASPEAGVIRDRALRVTQMLNHTRAEKTRRGGLQWCAWGLATVGCFCGPYVYAG